MRFLKKKPVKILTTISLFIAMLCLVGAVWNTVATRADMRKHQPLGQMVDVFDSKQHVFSVGNADNATVVLLSGWGTTSPVTDFYPLWSRLEEYAQVVVLERPGYGWSEKTDRARTVNNIMEENRLALTQAGFSPPYYLVAHSMGGLEAAAHAQSYPDEVSGVVLIDSRAPEIILEAPGDIAFMDKLVPSLKSIGLLRLINSISPAVIDSTYAKQNHYDLVDESYLPAERALTLRNAQNKMMRLEHEEYLKNAHFVNEQNFPENIPLLSIMADELKDNPRYSEMLEVQQTWVNQSAMGENITLHGGHYLHHYDPDGICDLIKGMIEGQKL